MKPLIFAIVFIAASAGIAWNLRRVIGYLKVGKPENRFDHVWERVKNVLVVAIGQSKLMREPVAGAIHAMIFWGFLVLLAAVIESIIEGLIPGGNISWLGPIYSVITISQDVFCLSVLDLNVNIETYTGNTGGVLYIEPASMWFSYFSIAGIFLLTFPNADLRTITSVVPAGPIFFCAPAYMRSNRLTIYLTTENI